MEKMKMIADWCYSEKPKGTRDWEDIPMEEKDWNSWWYLNGKLEDITHYDKATVTNCLSGGFAKDTINWESIIGDKVEGLADYKPTHTMCFDGIVDVEIEGIDLPCKGYFWTNNYRTVYWENKPYQIWDQRGLVCLADDEEACKYASICMKNNCAFL